MLGAHRGDEFSDYHDKQGKSTGVCHTGISGPGEAPARNIRAKGRSLELPGAQHAEKPQEVLFARRLLAPEEAQCRLFHTTCQGTLGKLSP